MTNFVSPFHGAESRLKNFDNTQFLLRFGVQVNVQNPCLLGEPEPDVLIFDQSVPCVFKPNVYLHKFLYGDTVIRDSYLTCFVLNQTGSFLLPWHPTIWPSEALFWRVFALALKQKRTRMLQ